LVRVPRRAGSGTVEARSQGQAPLLSAPRSHWGIGLANRSDHQQAGAVTVGPPTPPPAVMLGLGPSAGRTGRLPVCSPPSPLGIGGSKLAGSPAWLYR
jgi:hypothetical protein